MNHTPSRRSLDERLHTVAQDFVFPPTPQRMIPRPAKHEPLRLRRALVWAIMLVLALNALLAVPQVRATVRQWLRIGTVQIEIVETPLPTPSLSPALQSIGKPMTLAELRSTVAFTVPTVPDLGEPDQALLPNAENHVAVLQWHDPSALLYILDDQAWAGKIMFQENVTRTKINGHAAIWLKGQHEVFFYNPDTGQTYVESRTVVANVLIWTDDRATYRLEMDAPLETMQRIAEGLR